MIYADLSKAHQQAIEALQQQSLKGFILDALGHDLNAVFSSTQALSYTLRRKLDQQDVCHQRLQQLDKRLQDGADLLAQLLHLMQQDDDVRVHFPLQTFVKAVHKDMQFALVDCSFVLDLFEDQLLLDIQLGLMRSLCVQALLPLLRQGGQPCVTIKAVLRTHAQAQSCVQLSFSTDQQAAVMDVSEAQQLALQQTLAKATFPLRVCRYQAHDVCFELPIVLSDERCRLD